MFNTNGIMFDIICASGAVICCTISLFRKDEPDYFRYSAGVLLLLTVIF